MLSDPEKKKQHDLGGFSADDIDSGHAGMGGFPGGGFGGMGPGTFTFTTSGGPGGGMGGFESMGGGMPGGMGGMGFDPS